LRQNTLPDALRQNTLPDKPQQNTLPDEPRQNTPPDKKYGPSDGLSDDLRQKLINMFVKSNSGKFAEINEALNSGDIKLAHRLVHTLKSNAAQLEKTSLQKITMDIDYCLKNDKSLLTHQHLEVLDKELNAVLEELRPLVHEESEENVSQEQIDEAVKTVFSGELETLLEKNDVDSLTYIEHLRRIPKGGELIPHLENMDFKAAREALKNLEKNWI